MARRKSAKTIAATAEPVTGTKRKRDEEFQIESHSERVVKAVKQETRDCDICAETKTVYRNFPELSTCEHDATICSECYTKQFVTKIEADRLDGWAACTCPLCDAAVDPDEAQGIMPRTLSTEVNKLVISAQRQGAHNWLWCPAPGCGHGEIHNLTKREWVVCSRCRIKICFAHQTPWHSGFTCEEFDDLDDLDEVARKTLAEIRRVTKPCPYCKRRIKKEGGCNHMVCGGCGKNWMWNNIPFDGEEKGNSAEFAGGPETTRALGPAARAAVEQVIRFENAIVDNIRRTTGIRPRPTWTDAAAEFIESWWQAGTIRGREQAQQARVQRPPQPATPQNGRPGIFAGVFDRVRDVVRDLSYPTSAVRSTQQPALQFHRTAPVAGFTSSQRTVSTPQQTVGSSRPRITRSQTIRRLARPREMIDLTNSAGTGARGVSEIIDLTGDD